MKIFLCINTYTWTAGLNQSSKIVGSRLGKETKNEGHIQGALLVIWCWFQAVYLYIIVVSILRVNDFENDLGYVGVRATSGLSISSISPPPLPVQPLYFTATYFPCSWLVSICLQREEWESDGMRGERSPKAAGETPFLKADSPALCHSLAFATWVLAGCPNRRKLLYETGSSTKGIDFFKLFIWLMV